MKSLVIRELKKTERLNEEGDIKVKLSVFIAKVENGIVDEVKELWYETDYEWGTYFDTDRCDGVVVQLFLSAMRDGVDTIESSCFISEQLWYNLTYNIIPQLHIMSKKKYTLVSICAPTTKEQYKSFAIASGMSRGIDSFATFFEYNDTNLLDYKLTHLTYFNVGAHHGQGVKNRTMRARYGGQLKGTEKFCEEFGYPLIAVDTNLNSILYSFFGRWSFDRTHIYRNLGVVLLLQKLFCRYYYSSTYNLDNFEPATNIDCAHYEKWIIPLLSTESTTFHSANKGWERIDKTKFISDKIQCFNHLLVCFSEDVNCGKCAKCQRTLMQLDSLGNSILEQFSAAFDLDEYYKNDREKWFGQIDELMENGLMPGTYQEAFFEALRNNPSLIKKSKHVIKYDFPRKIVANINNINVRFYPTIESKIISKLKKGQTFLCEMECMGFYRYVLESGEIGWSVKKYFDYEEML